MLHPGRGVSQSIRQTFIVTETPWEPDSEPEEPIWCQRGSSAGKAAGGTREGGLGAAVPGGVSFTPTTSQAAWLAGGVSGVELDPMTNSDTSGHLLDCPNRQAPTDHLTQLCHCQFGEMEAPRRGAGALLGSRGGPCGWESPSPTLPPQPPGVERAKFSLNSGMLQASLP